MNGGNSAGKQLLLLLIGILMCGAGLYMFSSQIDVVVPSGFGRMYTTWGPFSGRGGIPTGATLIPLILGIVLWVIFPRNFIGKLVTMLGSLFIIFGVILSVDFIYRKSNFADLMIMIILIFGGGALALRMLFTPDLGDENRKRNKFDDINDKLN